MLERTSPASEETATCLQVDTDRAALSQDVAPSRNPGFLWTGFVFAVLTLTAVSAWALGPLASHASANLSSLVSASAFTPTLPARPGGVRPVIDPPRDSETGSVGFLSVVLPARGRTARRGVLPQKAQRDRISKKSLNDGARRHSAFPSHIDVSHAMGGLSMARIGSLSVGSSEDGQTPTDWVSRPKQLPREDWPAEMKFYRFIPNDDPLLKQEYSSRALTMPRQYQGSRKRGTYKGSFRLRFTTPRESQGSRIVDCVPKTVELLKSNELDNPSFGAVEVKLPLSIAVTQSQMVGKLSRLPVDVTPTALDARKRLVVSKVKEGNAELSLLQAGDIIRAMSVPAPTGTEKPWWEKAFQTEVPVAEEGMIMFDGLGVSAFEAALQENKRQRRDAVTLLIERPFTEEEDFDFFGGFPSLLPKWPSQAAEPILEPIPIPVEPDRRGGGFAGPRPGAPYPFLRMSDPDLGSSGVSDPVATAEEAKKKKEKNEYTVNMGEALDSLHHDLPHMFEIDEESLEWAPFNWNIYTDSLVTDYTTVDPLAVRLLQPKQRCWLDGEVCAAVMADGLIENQHVMQDLRSFVFRFVRRSTVMADTKMGVDINTGAEILESRWTIKLHMKRFRIPRWLSRMFGMSEPLSPEGVVIVEAMSRFHVDSDGRIYRHAIDRLNMRGVDNEGNRNRVLDWWMRAGPVPGGGLIPAFAPPA